MSEEMEVYQPAEKLQFRIEDDERASWAMKQLRDKVTQIRANQNLAAKEKRQIDDWLQDVNGSLASDADYFRGLLTDYMRRERENRKSIKLPWGTIKSTASKRVEVEPEFVQWAQENHRDDLLRFTPPEPNKVAIASLVDAEDVELPHVSVVESVSYSIKVKE